MIDHETIAIKIDEFIHYLHVERNVSIHTRQAYQSDLKQFSQFWCSLPEQKQLTFRQIVERYLLSLFHKKLNKSSIARKFSCFASFEKFLKSQDISLDLSLKRPHLEKKLPNALCIDEINYLLDTIKDQELPTRQPSRDKAIFELIYATGIRCSELIAIRLSDLDMVNKTILIRGKNKRERIVLFGEKAKDRINSYLNAERPASQSYDEPLFLNHSNEALTSRSVQRIIAMFSSFLTVTTPLTPHILRHSFAIHLHNQGVGLSIIQELLGLKTIASAEKYSHVDLERIGEMCETNHPIQKTARTRK